MHDFIAEAEREQLRNPADIWLSRRLATAYGNIGETAKAIAEIGRSYRRSDVTPGDRVVLATEGAYIAMGTRDRDQLVHWLTELGKLVPRLNAALKGQIAGLDQPAEALAQLQAQLRNPASSENLLGTIAPWLAYHGDAAGALQALRAEALMRGTAGAQSSLWLAVYRDLRKLPQFRQLVQDLELVDQWRQQGWGQFCKPVGKHDFDCGSGTVDAIDAPVIASDWQQIGSHRIRKVEVVRGVRLEVVDWGGTGRPVVLLGGLGASAHVFDGFAEQLTDRYHVYGITRRGAGISSRPATGYDVNQLADDVVAVLDALKLDRPVLAGHSIAGQELSSIGSRHPRRVAGLVYLDAHHYYAFYDKALQALQEAQAAAGKPYRIDEPASPPWPFEQAIIDGDRRFTNVGAPVLAIIAGKQGTQYAVDPALLEAQKKAIRAAAPTSRIVYLPEADHFVMGSAGAVVLQEMRDFIDGLR